VGLTSAGSLGDQGGKRERAAYAVHPKGWRNAMRDVIMESFRKEYVSGPWKGDRVRGMAWKELVLEVSNINCRKPLKPIIT
jgi:hypothetical protein